MTYRSITPSGPKSAAALTQIPPIAVVAKHAVTFSWDTIFMSWYKSFHTREKHVQYNWMNKMQLCPRVSSHDEAGLRWRLEQCDIVLRRWRDAIGWNVLELVQLWMKDESEFVDAVLLDLKITEPASIRAIFDSERHCNIFSAQFTRASENLCHKLRIIRVQL